MAERIGPFDAYLSEYDKMRASQNVEDRTGDPWPWHAVTQAEPKQSITDKHALDLLIANLRMSEIPPVTRLSRDLGARDVEAPSKEEVLRYLMHNAGTGPDPKIGGK